MPASARVGVVRVEQHSVEQHYEDPLPPAKELAKYKEIQKDLPERMMRIVEKEHDQISEERNSVHDYYQKQGIAESRRKDKAQVFAFVSILVIVVAATLATIYTDKVWVPALFGFMALPFLIGGYFGRLTDIFTKDKDKKK